MRLLRTLLPLPIAAASALAPRVASANVLFPSAITTHLGLSYTPPCTICHSSNLGGKGTVVQPFGLAMRGMGLTDPDPSTVGPALDALEAAQTDSDCNGTIDVQQLQDGRDPNSPGEYIDNSGKTAPTEAGCTNVFTPAFGCGAQLAPTSAPSDGAAPLLAALATVLGAALTRMRPRSRPRSRR